MSDTIFTGTSSLIQMKTTSEARLNIIDVTLTSEPSVTERDEIGATIIKFLDTYEGRLIVVVGFDGPEVQVSSDTITDLVGRLTCMKPQHLKMVKGCLVKPREMTSQGATLAALFKRLYSMKLTLLVTSKEDSQKRFIQKLIDREHEKRMKREASQTSQK